METLFTYLVAPYSHPNDEIVEDRVRAADAAMIALMNAGYTVYCPVCQWHRAALFYDVPTDAKYWREQNRAMLERLDVMHVLRLDGWLDSAGVAEEIGWAREMGIMVTEMEPLPPGNRGAAASSVPCSSQSGPDAVKIRGDYSKGAGNADQ